MVRNLYMNYVPERKTKINIIKKYLMSAKYDTIIT